jgi:hypothetical protein
LLDRSNLHLWKNILNVFTDAPLNRTQFYIKSLIP